MKNFFNLLESPQVKLILYLLASRTLFFIFAIFASFIVPLQEGYLGKIFDPSSPYLFWIWANFDGVHFLEIASYGYNNFDFAYFPLYPFFVSIFSRFLNLSELTSGIILSMIFLALSLLVIYKIILLDFKEKIARLTIFLILFSPFAFFYHSIYPDSLFLLTTTATLFFARKKLWILSGFCGMLAILTRLAGVSLLPALAAEWYLQNRGKLKEFNLQIALKFLKTAGAAIIISSIGLVLYMAYLQIFFGNFLLFQKSLSAWNQSSFILLPQVIFRYIKIFFNVEPASLVYWIAVLEFLSFFLYLWLAIFTGVKLRLSYGIYMIILLILVTFTGTFAGTPRYITHLFPAFLSLAFIIRDNKFLKIEIAILFLSLGFILTALFTRGYFIS